MERRLVYLKPDMKMVQMRPASLLSMSDGLLNLDGTKTKTINSFEDDDDGFD